MRNDPRWRSAKQKRPEPAPWVRSLLLQQPVAALEEATNNLILSIRMAVLCIHRYRNTGSRSGRQMRNDPATVARVTPALGRQPNGVRGRSNPNLGGGGQVRNKRAPGQPGQW
jgi:hypothetical protein